MNKLSMCVAGVLCLGGLARADTVTILFDAGLLENSTGTAVVPNGALLQVIASHTGVFAAPTSTSYVNGDNVLVTSFAMNSNSGIAGETTNAATSLPINGANPVAAGDKLLLRFFPSLTYANVPATPTLATSYGQVRSDAVEFGPLGGDGSETAWVVPSGGATVDMDYITVNDGGTYANATAYATNVVLAGVSAPEPSCAALIAGGLVAPLLRRRNRAL